MRQPGRAAAARGRQISPFALLAVQEALVAALWRYYGTVDYMDGPW